MKQHSYEVRMEWTGNQGKGTQSYAGYKRDHRILVDGKPEILGSSDAAFRGDPSRYSPEDLLVASLSACHMLWYLHLCAVNGISVIEYRDDASGVMAENQDGSGEFTTVTLNPKVTVDRSADQARATALHHEAHELCFIARSVRFPVEVSAAVTGAL